MFDLDLLSAVYTGKSIKIALIDTGFKSDSAKVKHINKKNIKYDHGTACGLCIMNAAPGVEIIDINILDEKDNILEKNVCEAIDAAINEKADIINISIGFKSYTNEFYEICKKAYDEGIIVNAAESHDGSIGYPADFDCVIKIDHGKRTNDNKCYVNRIDDSEFEVRCAPVEFTEKSGMSVKTVASDGSSISSAFFSATVALFLESRPLWSKKEIINYFFNISEEDESKLRQNNFTHKKINIEKNSAFTVLCTEYEKYIQYSDIVKNEFCTYYNTTEDTAYDICDMGNIQKTGSGLGDKDLYVVNPHNDLRASKYFKDNFQDKVHFIGIFDDSSTEESDKPYKKTIRKISTPVILIAGFGMNCSKFFTQLNIMYNMKKRLYPYCAITYNPAGHIYENMNVLNYSENIKYPDIIYNLNNYIKSIEDENSEYESIIINVAGGIVPVSEKLDNNFGILYDSYLKSAEIDFAVICTNRMVAKEQIKYEIRSLRLNGVKNIAIVVSDNTFDELCIETKFYQSDIETNKKYYDECAKYIKGTPVFLEQKKEEDELFKYIIQKLSC